MKKLKKLVARKIASEYILVPTGDDVIKSNGLFALTETGAFIWDKLSCGLDKSEIVEALLNEFDVDKAQAEADTDEFLNKLAEMKIITMDEQ